MWCKNCRQDTPGIRSAHPPGIVCGRCGEVLGAGQSDAASRATAGNRFVTREHPAEIGLDLGESFDLGPSFDDWQLAQNLHALEARLGGSRPQQQATQPQPAPAPSRRPEYRIDAAHTKPPAPHRRRKRARAASPGLLVPSALWLGLVALVGGGVLLGCSIVEQRPELWNLGLPVAASGACVFLLGLALQLERIWTNSRYAVHKLRQLDTQLVELERTTSMLGVTHGSASQAFYSHMAESASPHMLLADLKGQVDLLAMNLARGT
ncbi:MAG: hypothetical protein DWQ37_23150 [Planctomycetota bacterium]|nr:MAG: hypothetical protein DWQ37_23150 [Planctomycetota bacterium]